MIEVFIFSFIVMLASLMGVISIWKQVGKFIEQNLRFLVSFSAGVFLIVAYQLTIEAIEQSTISEGLLWVALGFVIIWLIFKLLPGFHHHHDEHEEEAHAHSKIDVRRILLSDAIHNIGDGVLLAASFTVSFSLGLITTLSIFVHELVQETSEFFVLRQAGFGVKKTLVWNFLVSATILIGSLGGFFLLESFETLEIPLLGFAAGSFLMVVIHDLIPHSVRESKTKTAYSKHFLWFLLGVLLMLSVNTFTLHSHESNDSEHEHSSHEEEFEH